MDYTIYKIETDITLLLSLLKMFSMLQLQFWYIKENVHEMFVENVAIRYINCGKPTGLL